MSNECTCDHMATGCLIHPGGNYGIRGAEPTPGVMHAIDKAFYDLAIAQRDAAWAEIDRLKAERDALADWRPRAEDG